MHLTNSAMCQKLARHHSCTHCNVFVLLLNVMLFWSHFSALTIDPAPPTGNFRDYDFLIPYGM